MIQPLGSISMEIWKYVYTQYISLEIILYLARNYIIVSPGSQFGSISMEIWKYVYTQYISLEITPLYLLKVNIDEAIL